VPFYLNQPNAPGGNNPPESLWLKGFFTDSTKSQEAGRAYLKRYLSRTENRDAPVKDKVAAAQIAAIGQWGTVKGERFAYLKNIKQSALVVSRNHDVIIYPVNALHLVQNMPNAKLIVYPDANHGSWYENHEDFVFETIRFLNSEWCFQRVRCLFTFIKEKENVHEKREGTHA
jgi:pimeloyl-ACP methyl ester carboxylesterase